MPKAKTIAERLVAAREKDRNLSQFQAAKKWKIGLQTLQSWEQSRRNPTGLYLAHVESILKRANV